MPRARLSSQQKAVRRAGKDPERSVLYITHPGPQSDAMTSSAEELLYGGAMGGGKSLMLRAWSVTYCMSFPGAQLALFRRSYRELEDTHILAIQKEVPTSVASYSSKSHNLVFNNGSIIQFRFCESDDDVATYFSAEYDAMLFDEITEFCFPVGEAEVLTRQGWRSMEAVSIGDKVATLGHGSSKSLDRWGRITFRPVVAVHRSSFSGNLVESGNSWFPLRVTPQHRVLVKNRGRWRLESVDELGDRRPIIVAGGKQSGWEEVGDFAEFLGWWLAEGYANAWYIDICQHKPHNDLHALLDRLFPEWKHSKNGYHHHVNDKKLAADFRRLGKSTERRLYRPALTWGARALERLLRAYIRGDGTWTSPYSFTAASASKGLLDDLQEVAVRIGWQTVVYRAGKLWRLGGNTRRKTATLRKKRYVPYRGDVICLEVPPYHNMMVRLGGRTFWSGNSSYSYTNLLSRCRSTKPWWPGRRIRCAGMPLGPGHVWVKNRWVDPVPPNTIWRGPASEGGLTRQFIPARATDNPTLMKIDPNYVKMLEALPYEEYRARALGDWNVRTDMFFQRWRDNLHVIEPFDIPPDWDRFICVDYGFNAPYCVLWFARPPGTHAAYFYREQYGAGVVLSEQVYRAKQAVIDSSEKIRAVVLDPAMFSKVNVKGERIESMADDWQRAFATIAPVIKGNNDRIMGWRLVREMLDWQERPDGDSLLNPPQLYVFRTCTNLARTMPLLTCDKNRVEDVDSDGEDHAPDAARYGLLHAFAGGGRSGATRRYFQAPRGIYVKAGA